MRAIRDPIDPLKLVVSWNALHSLITDTENRVCRSVLWEIKLDAWDR